jgi:uncharacterized protein YaiI (UPF0178 family)
MTAGAIPTFYIDADACPVKDEVYKVAARYAGPVKVVSNSFMMVPKDPLIERVVVDAGPDIADDWIAERAGPGDIVITADIPLAGRCLNAGAQVIGPRGDAFTEDSIGSALAGRAVAEHLRSLGEVTGGPKPFQPKDRSNFLQALDQAVQKAKRAQKR